MNKAINDLRARIGDAERKLNDLRNQIDDEYTRALMEKHGIDKDSVIVSNGKRYRFAGFDRPSSLAWVKGYLIKKDGSVSTSSRVMYYDWTKEA